MKNIFYSLLFLVSVGLVSCSNSTQKNTQTDTPAKQAIDTADARLAKDFSIFFQSQIEASKLALEKAKDVKVKEFAQQLITLYEGKNRALNQISAEYEVILPAPVSATIEVKLKDLKDIKTPYFDHAYLLMLLKQHNIMIREFNAAKSIQCTPLKFFSASNQSDIIKSAYTLADLKDKV